MTRLYDLVTENVRQTYSSNFIKSYIQLTSQCHHPQTFSLRLIFNSCLILNLYSMSLCQHFIVNLKFYVFVSQKTRIITFFLVSSVSEIGSKEE